MIVTDNGRQEVILGDNGRQEPIVRYNEKQVGIERDNAKVCCLLSLSATSQSDNCNTGQVICAH